MLKVKCAPITDCKISLKEKKYAFYSSFNKIKIKTIFIQENYFSIILLNNKPNQT